MSLPVRSPSKDLVTSSLPQPATLLRTVNPTSSSHQETSDSTPTTQKTDVVMSHEEANSFPLSSVPSTSPNHPSPTSATAPTRDTTVGTVQSGLKSANMTPPSSPPQNQQAHVPQHDSTPLTSDSNIECTEKQSPKRAHEEDDSSSSAFGTPPPKRIDRKASATSNGRAPKKNVVPSKKPTRKKSTSKSTATAPSLARSQPSRSRKAPERFEDFQEKVAPKARSNKNGQGKVFDPVFITTNSGSRLVKADIYHMLLEGAAWTCLSAEQQSTLISMLPQDTANKALLARVNAGEIEDTRPSAFTLANDCFRTDVAKFQEDLANGHLAKTWQAAAEQAVVERAAGEYDQWKAEEAELWWGQKSV